MITLSIIVPVYNVKEYLAACVDSIRAQSFREWELILVDDGSQDGSGALCDTLAATDPRIQVIHQENGGVSRARNTGIDAASGKYLAFVDGDDYIHPAMYAALIPPMEQGSDIVFCRFARVHSSGTVPHVEYHLPELVRTPWDYGRIIYEYCYQNVASRTESDNVFGSVCRSLFRGDIVRTHALRFPEDIRIAEDKLFMMAYLSFCETAHLVDEYLYYYRSDRAASATANGCEGYQPNLFIRRKSLLLREFSLIHRNDKLSQTEKKELIAYEKYRLAFDVVINELVYCPVYRQNLTRLFRDELLRTAIDWSSFAHMRKNGASAKRMALYGLIRLRCWGMIAWLLKCRRRSV